MEKMIRTTMPPAYNVSCMAARKLKRSMKYKPAVETRTNSKNVAARKIRRLVTVSMENTTMMAENTKNMN
jgi:hypothetical protein